MRINEPITDREFEIPDGEPLVSRTDRGGRIVFANHVFVESSGFAEQELIGAPHNIVRHPHMPQEAFANLWATIKAGRSPATTCAWRTAPATSPVRSATARRRPRRSSCD